MTGERGRSARVKIGRFWFDRDAFALEDEAGQAVGLRPQSMQVLDELVRHAGHVVAKDDLIGSVWSDIAVTDDSLTQCIADIRRVLKDKDRTLLKTFPKRGYMIAPCVENGGSDPAVPSRLADVSAETCKVAFRPVPGETDALSVELRGVGAALFEAGPSYLAAGFQSIPDALALARKVIATGLAVCAAVDRGGRDSGTGRLAELLMQAGPGDLFATSGVRDRAVDLLDGAFVDRGQVRLGAEICRIFAVHAVPTDHCLPGQATVLRDPRPVIAVIPPATTDGQEDRALSQILADDLVAALYRSQELNVISQLSTASLHGRVLSIGEIDATLKADYLLWGSLRGCGGKAVLNLELVDPGKGMVIWADRLEVETASISQGTMTAQKILSVLRRAILRHSVQDVRKAALPEVPGHRLLMSAIDLMHRFDHGDFLTARQQLAVLMERYPDQPVPLAWQARWHVLGLQQGWSEDPVGTAGVAQDLARRALDLDPENVLALTCMGHVLTNLRRDLDEAEGYYNVALEINPSDVNGRALRGMLNSYRGSGSAGREDAELALQLTPLDPHRFFYLTLAAGANIVAGDHARALALSDQSLRLNRHHTSTHRGKIVAQVALGQIEGALRTGQELLALQPDFRVDAWRRSNPAADYEIGGFVASCLLKAGIPD